MDRICDIFFRITAAKISEDSITHEMTATRFNHDTEFEPMINIAHNYASLENHYGKNVWVHRKGATLARKGTIGIIPGSMGTSSYIVEGLGNKESFESCSHGAGRKMGRRQAIENLNLDEEQKKMKNILGKPRNKEDLQEAPGAYKNIIDVINNEKDLVKVLVKLKPLAVIKG
jgi:tRNA-splicing ligase RtcB